MSTGSSKLRVSVTGPFSVRADVNCVNTHTPSGHHYMQRELGGMRGSEAVFTLKSLSEPRAPSHDTD